MPVDHCGEQIAQRYDADVAEMFDAGVVEPTVTLLAEFARGGAALELGIGTGRVALPLRRRLRCQEVRLYRLALIRTTRVTTAGDH